MNRAKLILLSAILFLPGMISYAGDSGWMTPRIRTVKTNLAYDIFAVLNAEASFQVHDRVTVDIPVAWSLWDWKDSFGLRIVAVQPRAMYWFVSTGSGHSAGLCTGFGFYNFRNGDRRYQDKGRPALTIGLSYAYTLPITDKCSAEFSVSAGYVNTRYNSYYNVPNGAYIKTGTLNYFGPTQFGISICYRLGK